MNPLQVSTAVATAQARPQAQTIGAVSLHLDESCSDERCTLEAQIAERFASRFSAHLSHFLPLLLSLRHTGALTSVVGLQPASADGLFLERYLDIPVERALSEAANVAVDRNSVIEIGNLVSIKRGASYLLFAVLATALHKAGFRWVVCTATRQIRAMLDDMGFSSQVLCNADATRLGDNGDEWGDYYDASPQVITGDIREAAESVASHPNLSVLVEALQPQVCQIAAKLAGRV